MLQVVRWSERTKPQSSSKCESRGFAYSVLVAIRMLGDTAKQHGERHIVTNTVWDLRPDTAQLRGRYESECPQCKG